MGVLSDSYVVHSGGFVTLPNSTVNDTRMTYRARGVLAYLIGRPPGWRFSAEAIARAGGEAAEGRDAIRKVLRELAAAGYYRVTRVQTPDGFVMVTEVAAAPQLLPPPAEKGTVVTGPGAEPGGGLSASGNPASGGPASGNPPPLSIQESQERDSPLQDRSPQPVDNAVQDDGGGGDDLELTDADVLAQQARLLLPASLQGRSAVQRAMVVTELRRGLDRWGDPQTLAAAVARNLKPGKVEHPPRMVRYLLEQAAEDLATAPRRTRREPCTTERNGHTWPGDGPCPMCREAGAA